MLSAVTEKESFLLVAEFLPYALKGWRGDMRFDVRTQARTIHIRFFFIC